MMSRIRTLIVDDEQLARKGVRVLLDRDPDIEVIGECSNGDDAIESIRMRRPELVFLDVQMPEKNGFDVLEHLAPDETPCVVFCTAYDEYALRAFEVHALDYLLKPFDDDRFEKALGRIKSEIARGRASDLGERVLAMMSDRDRPPEEELNGARDRLVIRSPGRVVFLEAGEIDWIEAADYYVRIHAGEKTHLQRETMSSLESKLDSAQFIRIHRSTIVNIDAIREMQPLARKA